MPEPITEQKKPKVQPKVMIDDKGEETEKPKGVSFLGKIKAGIKKFCPEVSEFISGALLVVLVVAAIGSFSIVAMELGEIKRLVGLKESTGKEIKENETKISSLKESISKLITDKLSAEEASSRANVKKERFEDAANAWEEYFKRFKKAVSDNNETLQEIKRLNIKLNSENNSLSTTLSELRTQKNLLESQIEDLKPAKEELSKYTALIADKKAELVKINTQKKLALDAKYQSEETLIELKAQITALELGKRKALEETKKNEVSAKIALKELEDAKIESSLLKGQFTALLEGKSESQTRNNILVKENSKLATERDTLNSEILKLNQGYGRKRADLDKLIESYERLNRAVQGKKAETQNQSN